MSADETFSFSMSADGGRTWQLVSAHESWEEMHEHIGRIVSSTAFQMPGSVVFEARSHETGGVTVSGGVMRWEWNLT
jgi:hypothetical protein